MEKIYALFHTSELTIINITGIVVSGILEYIYTMQLLKLGTANHLRKK